MLSPSTHSPGRHPPAAGDADGEAAGEADGEADGLAVSGIVSSNVVVGLAGPGDVSSVLTGWVGDCGAGSKAIEMAVDTTTATTAAPSKSTGERTTDRAKRVGRETSVPRSARNVARAATGRQIRSSHQGTKYTDHLPRSSRSTTRRSRTQNYCKGGRLQKSDGRATVRLHRRRESRPQAGFTLRA